HRDVCQARHRAIRHRRPAVSAADGRPDSRNRSIRELRTGWLYRMSRPEVYSLGPGHLRERLCGDQLPVGSVNNVKESILRRLQQYLTLLAVDEEIRQLNVHSGVVVPAFTRIDLVMPSIFP